MNSSEQFAELSIDGQSLLLPHTQVRLVESVLDLHSDPARPPGQWINSTLGELPVWHLDRHLKPLEEPPTGRRFCVLLAAGSVLYGLSARSFQLRPRKNSRRLPLPAMLRLADTPLSALVVLDERILALADASLLAHRLGIVEQTP